MTDDLTGLEFDVDAGTIVDPVKVARLAITGMLDVWDRTGNTRHVERLARAFALASGDRLVAGEPPVPFDPSKDAVAIICWADASQPAGIGPAIVSVPTVRLVR